ncbi:hypothetical protein V8C37DRAFT_376518 [Trichoderma ceciliae]
MYQTKLVQILPRPAARDTATMSSCQVLNNISQSPASHWRRLALGGLAALHVEAIPHRIRPVDAPQPPTSRGAAPCAELSSALQGCLQRCVALLSRTAEPPAFPADVTRGVGIAWDIYMYLARHFAVLYDVCGHSRPDFIFILFSSPTPFCIASVSSISGLSGFWLLWNRPAISRPSPEVLFCCEAFALVSTSQLGNLKHHAALQPGRRSINPFGCCMFEAIARR